MNLIFENWNKFLNDEKAKAVILHYIKENNIQLTEQQIQENMPGWIKKMVAAGMLITTAAGAIAPNPAQADTWQQMFELSSGLLVSPLEITLRHTLAAVGTCTVYPLLPGTV